MPKLKPVVGLSNIEGLAERASALAQVWARQIQRTHRSLYEALGQCLLLYRAAKSNGAGFEKLCHEAQFYVSPRARSEVALGSIRLAFDPTPVDADARFRYSLWSACLLGLDEARPTLRTPEAAVAYLERSGIRRTADAYRDRHRPELDKQQLIEIERATDRRIQDFIARGVPLTKLDAKGSLKLALIDKGKARLLDLNPSQVRGIVAKALE